jgi:hypothetical protein
MYLVPAFFPSQRFGNVGDILTAIWEYSRRMEALGFFLTGEFHTPSIVISGRFLVNAHRGIK